MLPWKKIGGVLRDDIIWNLITHWLGILRVNNPPSIPDKTFLTPIFIYRYDVFKTMRRSAIILIPLILIILIPPVYAQTVNCPSGCTITVTPDQQAQQQSSGSTLQSSSPTIGGFNLGSAIQGALQALQNFFTGIEGNSIPDNSYVDKTGVQNATGAGFNVIGDMFKTGFDASKFVADLINSFKLFHVSFWIIMIISMAITFYLIIRSGEDIVKRIIIAFLSVTAILALLWFVFSYLNL